MPTSIYDLPTVLRDDTYRAHTMLVFNSDPDQHMSDDIIRKRSVVATRFRQFPILQQEPQSSSVRISLIPVLTFIERSTDDDLCRPQVYARVEDTGPDSRLTGVSELCARFLEAWQNSSTANKTVQIRNNENIMSAIKDIEALVETVVRTYASSCRVGDSHKVEDQALVQDEWYALPNDTCASPSSFAFTDLSQPSGILFDGSMKYIDLMWLVVDVETGATDLIRGPLFDTVACEEDELALFRAVAAAPTGTAANSAFSGTMACNDDLNDRSILDDVSGTEAIGDGNRGVGHRGPLGVRSGRLVETFSTLQDVLANGLGIAVEQGPPTRSAVVTGRVQLRPLSLLHLDRGRGVFYLGSGMEAYVKL